MGCDRGQPLHCGWLIDVSSMVCPGRSSFGLGEMPQDQDADQSPKMKQAVAGRSSSVSPPRRKLTGGTDRAGYAPKENTNQRRHPRQRPRACTDAAHRRAARKAVSGMDRARSGPARRHRHPDGRIGDRRVIDPPAEGTGFELLVPVANLGRSRPESRKVIVTPLAVTAHDRCPPGEGSAKSQLSTAAAARSLSASPSARRSLKYASPNVRPVSHRTDRVRLKTDRAAWAGCRC